MRPILINPKLSNKLANFSLVCSALVVLIHVEPQCANGSVTWWTYELLGGGLSIIAVPFFFTMSGFLLAGHIGEPEWYKTAIKKRIRSLLAPYCVCAVLYSCWISLLSLLSNVQAHRELLANIDLSLSRFFVMFGMNPFFQPEFGVLWYVRCLMVLILLSPLINLLANKVGLLVLWGVYLCVCHSTSAVEGTWKIIFRFFISLEGLFYFALGLFLRNNPVRIPGRNLVGVVSLLAGLTCMIVESYVNVDHPGGCGGYLKWSGLPFTLFGAWRLCPTLDWGKSLTSSSFPLYLLHGFVTIFLGGVIIKNLAALSFFKTEWWGYLLSSCIVVGVSLVATRIIRRSFPCFARLFFGGR